MFPIFGVPDNIVYFLFLFILEISVKGEFQICPRMDFDNILYAEYLRYNNYKNEIILFLERLLGHRGAL